CNANDPALLVYDQLDDQNWSSLKSHAKLDFFRPNWEKQPKGVNNGNTNYQRSEFFTRAVSR
ncbi:MAG: hypothetical protein ACXACI_15210, partial [Candidatus Hodarchaeales archaeon]